MSGGRFTTEYIEGWGVVVINEHFLFGMYSWMRMTRNLLSYNGRAFNVENIVTIDTNRIDTNYTDAIKGKEFSGSGQASKLRLGKVFQVNGKKLKHQGRVEYPGQVIFGK